MEKWKEFMAEEDQLTVLVNNIFKTITTESQRV